MGELKKYGLIFLTALAGCLGVTLLAVLWIFYLFGFGGLLWVGQLDWRPMPVSLLLISIGWTIGAYIMTKHLEHRQRTGM